MTAKGTIFRLAILTLVSGVLGLAGCGGHSWKMVRDMPPPSPLKGAGPISVSFDYSRIMIGGKNEQDWVQSKMADTPGYEKSWANLKNSFETNLVAGLSQGWAPGAQMGPVGAPGVHLVVVPTSLSMGHYMLVAASPTVVTADMAFTVDGREAEIVSLSGSEFATVFKPSVHQHIPGVATYIGRNAGRFVVSRN